MFHTLRHTLCYNSLPAIDMWCTIGHRLPVLARTYRLGTICLGREVRRATGSFGSVYRIEYQCSIKAAKVADTTLTHEHTHKHMHSQMHAHTYTRAGVCKCTNTHAHMPTRKCARARTHAHGTKVIDMSRATAKERNRMLRMNNNELAILVQVARVTTYP